MKKNPNCNHSSSSSSPFPSPTSVLPSPPRPGQGIGRDSRMISKPPKIRIIHIFAPEIIKTDVANFRELVHRLTGKPTRLHPPPEPTPHLPPPMPEYDGGRDHDDEEVEEEAGAAAGQYGFSGENYGNNDDDGSSLALFGSGNCSEGFGFEFLSAKESGTTGGTVKAEEENEMALWINSDRNSGGGGGGEVGGGTCFGELDDGFIEELGEFPLLVEQNHHQQHHNYSHQRLNYNLHGFGSEATQFA